MWTQDNDAVTILFPLPAGINKDDILFEVKTKYIKLGLKDRKTLLDGDLFGVVESDSCTWTVESQRYYALIFLFACFHVFQNVYFILRLEVTLMKSSSNNESWTEVVKGDQRGIYQVDGKDMTVLGDIINTQMVI